MEGFYFHYSLSVCVSVCLCVEFYFHCSLSVCVSVCLCVCPTLLVNKIPAEWMHRFRRGFHYKASSDPIEIGDLGSKVKVTVT